MPCYHLGGLGFALCVGVDAFYHNGAENIKSHIEKFQRWDWASGMAGSVCSVMFPEIRLYVSGIDVPAG